MNGHKMIVDALTRCRDAELAAVLRLAREMEDAQFRAGHSEYSSDQRTKGYQSSLIHLNRAFALKELADALEKGEHRPRRRVRKPKLQEAAS